MKHADSALALRREKLVSDLRRGHTADRIKKFSQEQRQKLLLDTRVWSNRFEELVKQITEPIPQEDEASRSQLASSVEELEFMFYVVVFPQDIDLRIVQVLAGIVARPGCGTGVVRNVYRIFEALTATIDRHRIRMEYLDLRLIFQPEITGCVLNTLYNMMVKNTEYDYFDVTEYLVNENFSLLLDSCLKTHSGNLEDRDTLCFFLFQYLEDMFVIDHSLAQRPINQSLCQHLEALIAETELMAERPLKLLSLFSNYKIKFNPFKYSSMENLPITPSTIRLYFTLTYESDYSLSDETIERLITYALEVPSHNGLIYSTLVNNTHNDSESTKVITRELVRDRHTNHNLRLAPFEILAGSSVRQFATLLSKIVVYDQNLEVLEGCLAKAETANPLLLVQLSKAGVELVPYLEVHQGM